MNIRAAAPRDAPVLARLRYDLRCELGTPVETEAAFVARCTSWMRERIGAESEWRCWVAEEDGEVAGNLWLCGLEKLPNPVAERERHAYVTNVYVIPARRGAGIGGRLLEAALEWCRGAEVDAVLLWPSKRSRSLYARYGFGVRDDLFVLRPAGG